MTPCMRSVVGQGLSSLQAVRGREGGAGREADWISCPGCVPDEAAAAWQRAGEGGRVCTTGFGTEHP